jgi:hypothetical protein
MWCDERHIWRYARGMGSLELGIGLVAATGLVLVVSANLPTTMPGRRGVLAALKFVAGLVAARPAGSAWVTMAVLVWLVVVGATVSPPPPGPAARVERGTRADRVRRVLLDMLGSAHPPIF